MYDEYVKENFETQKNLLDAYDKYHKVLYNYIFFQVNMRKDIADDLTQDVFMRAWEKRSSFNNSKGSLKNWLYTIARNISIDYFRAKRSDVVDESFWENAVGTFKDSLEADMHFLYAAMEELSQEEKELITLRFIQQYELRELAEIFGVTYGNIKVKSHRAFTKLKEILNKKMR